MSTGRVWIVLGDITMPCFNLLTISASNSERTLNLGTITGSQIARHGAIWPNLKLVIIRKSDLLRGILKVVPVTGMNVYFYYAYKQILAASKTHSVCTPVYTDFVNTNTHGLGKHVAVYDVDVGICLCRQ